MGRDVGSWCCELVLTVYVKGKADEPRPRLAQGVQQRNTGRGEGPILPPATPPPTPQPEGLKAALRLYSQRDPEA